MTTQLESFREKEKQRLFLVVRGMLLDDLAKQDLNLPNTKLWLEHAKARRVLIDYEMHDWQDGSKYINLAALDFKFAVHIDKQTITKVDYYAPLPTPGGRDGSIHRDKKD